MEDEDEKRRHINLVRAIFGNLSRVLRPIRTSTCPKRYASVLLRRTIHVRQVASRGLCVRRQAILEVHRQRRDFQGKAHGKG